MESQPQNPEFKNNPENSLMYNVYIAELNDPLLSTEMDHFRFKGCWVVFFIFIKILIEHSVS